MFTTIFNYENLIMKNLLSLGEILDKKEQKSINGGAIPIKIGCPTSCANKPTGTKCWGTSSCDCPGMCSGGQCVMY